MLLTLASIPIVLAHGDSFSASAVSIHPDAPDEIWVLTEQWGLGHAMDGGESWEWLCEESLGAAAIYGVLASAPGEALLATREGVRRLGPGCSSTAVEGLATGVFVPAVAGYRDGFLALGIGPDEGGIWSCSADACVPSDLMGEAVFPKSALADGTRAWVTIVYEESLASALWRSDDGLRWTKIHEWPAGDTDPRVLRADGDRLLVWRRTRTTGDTPELLVSDDGGETFRVVLADGYHTDLVPALLDVDGAMLLGSEDGTRTWRSEDDGESWTDVKEEVPAVRCATTVAGVGYACGDHVFDGFDLSRTEDGRTWIPVACLEEAFPASCAAETCDPLLGAYITAGSFGGGKCDTIIRPPEPAVEENEAEERSACECGAGGGAAGFLVLLGLARRRGRERDGGIAVKAWLMRRE